MPTPGAVADSGAVAIEDVLSNASADTSVDDAVDTSTDDGADSSVDDVTATDDSASTDDAAATDDSADADQDKQDGRAMPPKLRSLLKEVQAKDPKLAKELK